MVIKSASALLLSVLLLTTGCGKGDNPEPTPAPASSSRMSAKINGTTFYAGVFSLSSTAHGLSLSGSTDNVSRPTAISFTISNYAGLSTYSVDTSTLAAFTQLGLGYPVSSGTITVTTDNAVHTAGTFDLQAGSGGALKQITDGSFDIYK